MTALTSISPISSRAQQPAVTPRFSDTVRSEWTKFRSVRSTPISLLIGIVLAIGVGALISNVRATNYHQAVHAVWDPTTISLRGVMVAQLAIAVLGVLVITSEYSTGMIRTSLAAVPRRPGFLAAKMLVFTAVSVVVGEIVSFVAFLVGQGLISGKAPTASLSQGVSLRAVIGAGLYLAVLGIIAVGIGVIVRSTAGAIASIVALLYVLPGLVSALPNSWSQPLSKYWPTDAGSQVYTVVRESHTLSAWAGFADMCVFAAIVLAVGFYLLKKRDA